MLLFALKHPIFSHRRIPNGKEGKVLLGDGTGQLQQAWSLPQ